MGEVDRLVTQTALAIRDADELEVAASVLDAALRAAKAEVWREAATVHRQVDGNDCKYCLARAAQIEEGSDVARSL